MAHISLSNSKLGSIPSINLPPIVTCRPDAPCKSTCYACNGRFRFKNVKQTLESNFEEWKSDPGKYMQSVIDACTNVRFFRWHSAGDIPDEFYLTMMYIIAGMLKEVRFLAFTKKYDLVNSYISKFGKPDNLSIVLSAWGNMVPENPHNLPVAYVLLKSGEGEDRIPARAVPCSGSCNECIKDEMNCWKLKPGMSVVFKQH